MKDYNARDVMFVQEMIDHHETAVMMAASESVVGENAAVKEHARAIFAGQSAEIAWFKAWLKERGLPESADDGDHEMD